MTDDLPSDSPYAAPASRIVSDSPTGLSSIWPRFLCTLAITTVPSTTLMMASMGEPDGNGIRRFIVIMLLWALPSWFILWPTFRASGGWRRTEIGKRILVPCLFGIALGISTFVFAIVASVALSMYGRWSP